MLALLGWLAAAALTVITLGASAAVGVVLRREQDHLLKIDRLEKQNAGYAADNNVLRSRLTRRKNPIIPPQRKAS